MRATLACFVLVCATTEYKFCSITLITPRFLPLSFCANGSCCLWLQLSVIYALLDILTSDCHSYSVTSYFPLEWTMHHYFDNTPLFWQYLLPNLDLEHSEATPKKGCFCPSILGTITLPFLSILPLLSFRRTYSVLLDKTDPSPSYYRKSDKNLTS